MMLLQSRHVHNKMSKNIKWYLNMGWPSSSATIVFNTPSSFCFVSCFFFYNLLFWYAEGQQMKIGGEKGERREECVPKQAAWPLLDGVYRLVILPIPYVLRQCYRVAPLPSRSQNGTNLECAKTRVVWKKDMRRTKTKKQKAPRFTLHHGLRGWHMSCHRCMCSLDRRNWWQGFICLGFLKHQVNKKKECKQERHRLSFAQPIEEREAQEF